MAPGISRWFLNTDGLRWPWRVLLFVFLFGVLLWLEGVLLPAITQAEVPEDRISPELVVQTALVLVAALGAAWILLRVVERRPLRGLGFPLFSGGGRELWVGVAVGAGALMAVVAVFALFGGYRYTGDSGSPGDWLVMVMAALGALAIPAAAEEALVRGYPFRAMVEGPGPWAAILLTSVVFAALHLGNPNAQAFGIVNILLAGVLLGVAVVRTGTLWLATGVHLGWNWAMAGPLDLPVSGLQGLDVPLYDAVSTGPAWLTGGPFGPEGGLAGTLAALVALALVIRLTRPGAVLAGAGTDRSNDDVPNR